MRATATICASRHEVMVVYAKKWLKRKKERKEIDNKKFIVVLDEWAIKKKLAC